jgi:hypothetical protein
MTQKPMTARRRQTQKMLMKPMFHLKKEFNYE